MASIIIRKLEDTLKRRLRIRAAQHGRSMEEEARTILHSALTEKAPRSKNLADAVRSRFAPLGGVNLPTVPRQPIRHPPIDKK